MVTLLISNISLSTVRSLVGCPLPPATQPRLGQQSAPMHHAKFPSKHEVRKRQPAAQEVTGTRFTEASVRALPQSLHPNV